MLLLAPSCGWAKDFSLVVLLSGSQSAYQSFAETLQRNLPTSVTTRIVGPPHTLASQPPADLIIAVGLSASLAAIKQPNIPVFVVMVPRTSYDKHISKLIKTESVPPVSGIYLDQPWDRQLRFIQAILPTRHRIGILYSNAAEVDMALMESQVSGSQARLATHLVLSELELFPSLEELLLDSDLILAVPDTTIYSSSNIRNILLSCYRSEKPLIGLSQAYVTAGALGAVFTTVPQLAAQISDALRFFDMNGSLPRPAYPREFTISLNRGVGRSMGISLPPDDDIVSLMNNVTRSDK
jgi:putative ABC transport system substrate-binding protein